MNIGYLCDDDESRTDSVLTAVARRAAQAGIRLAGTVQPVTADPAAGTCQIVLALLPDEERRDISFPPQPGTQQDADQGCCLNPAALEDAVLVVHRRLPAAQALVVNKFGRQEAAGRGLVAAIGEACERGLPVLVGVAPAWKETFLAFAGGHAVSLAAQEHVVFDWLQASCADSPAA